jgi:two-component system cell cycle sensor histidine kinase/response regulator CckA
MTTPLHVLILEDQETDAELMVHELRHAGFAPDWQRVETKTEYLDHLNPGLDIILADYSLPQFDALRALLLLHELGLDIPFIVVTGTYEEVAMECLKQGATDYLLKDRLARLGEAVKHALKAKEILDEKRQAEEALREQALQLQGILNTVQDGILTMESDGRIMHANPAAHEYLKVLGHFESGGMVSQLAGHSLREFFTPPMTDLPHEVILEGTPQRIFEIRVNPAYIGTEHGTWTFLIREVTEARQTQKRAQLQERLAAVGQLAAGIAHDFNNILGTITLFTELLHKAQGLTAKDHERLNMINRQAHRAASLIRQILDFSRRSVMERHPMDLVPFLKEIFKLLERTLPSSIQNRLVFEEGGFVVNADPTRMQQLFMNLALNGRDAMPDGGELRFELSHLHVEPDEPPPFRDMPPGDWVDIRVTDNGAGILPEILPHIFEPFFTTKQPGEGTGLGLAQVYGIVKQHDGYIDLKSKIGEGTTFIIYLPALKEPAVPQPVPEEVSEEMGRRETILVVEDDETTQQVVGEILESLNYHVLLAADGQEALAILGHKTEEIDLVLSDLVMPTIGGVALYEKLREMSPDVPMVVMTGYPLGQETRERLDERSMTRLQKPLTSETIARALRKVLTSKQED